MDKNELDRRFTYLDKSPLERENMETLRDAIRQVAMVLNDLTPDSREKSLALTHLEETMFWGNVAIARNSR